MKQNHEWLKKVVLYLVTFAITVLIMFFDAPGREKTVKAPPNKTVAPVTEKPDVHKREEVLQRASYLAATYDYDSAVNILKELPQNEEVAHLIKQYESDKAACVPVNVSEVTHIFYHSLVVDPKRCFANQKSDPQAAGNNQWMTTVDEFNKITQEMYDRGYVLVSIHDLVTKKTDKKGRTVYKPGKILLPKGKKAFVLSLDDLSYYHSYDGYGYASKLILDNERVTNEYIDAKGRILTGDYDCVPLLDRFIEKHPDASYHGAKGLIALTGYNGILGYRTDISYKKRGKDLDKDKVKWLDDNPGFDLKTERGRAKMVADAMKANGWEFASHTWGHLRIGGISLKTLKADTKRWKKNVEPLVGATDAIVFAHGQDLNSWGNYNKNDSKYKYLRKQGYSVFCNVDSHQHMTWFGEDYLRQGRRNLDGYRIYNNAVKKQDNVADLFDAKKVLDPLRPPVPDLYPDH